MNKLENQIDLQIESNRNKNLFHKDATKTMHFAQTLFDEILNLKGLTENEVNVLIEYTCEKVVEEFCRVNQYYSFGEDDKKRLKDIYRDLYFDIIQKKIPMNLLSERHYQNLKSWVEESNPFSKIMYQKEDITVQPVVCCEYSADIQKHILHLQLEELPEPILDVGSGKHGNLVKSLRAAGLIVYGIDRFSDCSWVEKADWLTYDYGMEKWGTIISNLGFSNHFLHHHLREEGNFIGYAKKYMEILNSLKLHGRMYYAPELPFIEQYLDKNSYSITKHAIENISLKATMIKRLK
ncbi:MAG TPA: hypothetical protein DEF88_12210 [Porphyromonadaceae bacterium]|jgi:hypothetical protein|nr:hypothetical protein [Porphyromonadaceae bacterium]HBX21201.1 hypothetical protein [Porphyromonadaceae bacterium]